MIVAASAVDLQVFRRYAGLSLPRHVSYPMPTWWQPLDQESIGALHERARDPHRGHGVSLYVHIPFCEQLCKFCACTRIIQRKTAPGAEERTERYLAALETELAQMVDAIGRDRVVRQVHWGGGSPTYLSAEQIGRIQRRIGELYNIADDAEIAMEIDPRSCPPEKLVSIRSFGFNRVSLGVQDFDERVQEHVRRIQPLELVQSTVAKARELGFDSVNFDLIYGLPYQTTDSVRELVDRTIELSPDRIAFYHYAQIPDKIATQRGMDYTKLPDSEAKLAMFLVGLYRFQEAGYEFVGLDHFARPTEALSRAADDGTLQRNFQGMTTGGGLDLYGAGASSISHLMGIGFLQNVREVDDYLERIEGGTLPIHRGKPFTDDDLIRQGVLNQLYCAGEIRPAVIERVYGITFADYFARELGVMAELERDGLVSMEDSGVIRATVPLGRVLMRTIAAVFDAYLEADAYRVGDRNCFSANA